MEYLCLTILLYVSTEHLDVFSELSYVHDGGLQNFLYPQGQLTSLTSLWPLFYIQEIQVLILTLHIVSVFENLYKCMHYLLSFFLDLL